MIINKNRVYLSVPQCVSGIKTLKLRIGKRFARIPQNESHLSRFVIKLDNKGMVYFQKVANYVFSVILPGLDPPPHTFLRFP